MALDTAKATVILKDLTKKFDNAVQASVPFYPRVCTTVPSDGLDEKYGILGQMPGVREWLDDRQFKELRSGNFTIANRHWESSLAIKKTDLADDRMALYGPLMEQLGAEATHHPDELLFTAILDGQTAACFDGQFFFDTDHAWGDSGSQDNDLTSNIATPSAPTAAEFLTSYHAARTAMMKFKNDQGKFMNRAIFTSQANLLCLVPPEHELAAHQAFEGRTMGGATSADVVVDRPQVATSPLLTNNDRWYLLNLSAPLKPFVFQARSPLERQMKGLDDIETKDVKFMTEARYNVGYLAWWTAVLTTFT